jgi:hypothetical protein
MTDPVQTALAPLHEVEAALSKYVATPALDKAKVQAMGTSITLAQLQAASRSQFLTALAAVLKVTYAVGDVAKVGTSIADGLGQAAEALVTVANKLGELGSVQLADNMTPAKLIHHVQAAIALAQAILPGGTPGLAAGGQFFDQLAKLLDTMQGDVLATRVLLYRFALELQAVRTSLTQ